MLKTRLIPCIITKGDLVVQSFNFKKYLPIGNVKIAIDFFVNWDVDEIIIIDIDAYREKRKPNLDLVRWVATECFVPLCIGGGITSTEDIGNLLDAGADKVCINAVNRDNPRFIEEAAFTYGRQCITASMDVVVSENSEYKVYDYLKKEELNVGPVEYAIGLENRGAGEILLNSVDRDGSREGYDISLLKLISTAVKIPVIACGGVGKVKDLSDGVLKGGCQAVSAANIFQHTEHSTIAAKAHLLRSGVKVRLNSSVKYENFNFDLMGRPY